MHKAILKVYHIGCWGSDISLKFPKLEFFSIDVRWVDSCVAHIVKAVGDNRFFDKILDYYNKRKDVKTCEELSRSNSEIYIRTITKDNPKHPSFSNMFFKNNCFPIAPTKFENKYEIWTIETADRANLTKAYNLLKEENEVHIDYLKQDDLKANLTQKQRQAMMYAKYFGYFSWPRKKSATEIAEILKMPKTVFLSHLRKAENKILNEYRP